MALVARYLIDASASAHGRSRVAGERLANLVAAGVVATCATLDAEALFSARTPADYEDIRARRRVAYEYLPTDDEHWRLALEAQRQLASSGRHRSVGIIDLLTATVAAQHRLTVLHYNADFDIAADVIDFRHEWIAKRGSLR